MKPIDTMERIAELLPEDRREKFFATMVRLRNIPEEDEFLLILEAIGFMTLIWSEIPGKIKDILSGAGSGEVPHENIEYLLRELRKSINEALDLPSYGDLRQMVHELREQQAAFVHSANRLQQKLAEINMSTNSKVQASNWSSVIVVLLILLFGTAALYIFL